VTQTTDPAESDALHGWGTLLADLERRREAARAMGGPTKVARHREGGRLDARARVERLFDPGSFVELGALVGGAEEPPVAGDALVAGFGRIHGRPALVGAEDFTVMGGSIGTGAASKRYRLCQLAIQERVPLVFMLEGAGHRLTNRHGGRGPNDLQGLADVSGNVPMVCLVMGASAGHGALTAPLSDFTIMTRAAALFSAGPPLVKAATFEDVTKEELGGWQVHVETSGVVHNVADTDADALDMARAYLRYFPLNAWEGPPHIDTGDTGKRRLDGVLATVPTDNRKPYRMRAVLEELVDAGTLFEVQPLWGRAVICALAFLGGRAVAIVANNPAVKAGTVDSDAADKATHFIGVASAFHLPLVMLADNPGVMAGTAAERAGALRAVARMFAAQHRHRGPKLVVTLRKAFGFGSTVMGMNPFDGQTISVAFPGVILGAMPARSGGGAAKLDADTQARVDLEQAQASYRIASGMGFDDVIDPRDLRNALLDALSLSEGRASGPFAPVSHSGVLP
jgi:methylmalonyl-CoA decarboxylase subunit alpha